ncbi:hypothetical protein ACVWZR_000268 [Bradyrhizobium sp. i1.3.1]
MLRLKEAAPVSRDLNIGQIDTAELLLHRVYAFGAAEGHASGESVGQDAAGWERAEMALLQAEIDTQRQIIKLLRNELSDRKKERDASLGAVGLPGCVDQFRLTSRPPRAPDRLRHLSTNVEYISGSIDSNNCRRDRTSPIIRGAPASLH